MGGVKARLEEAVVCATKAALKAKMVTSGAINIFVDMTLLRKDCRHLYQRKHRRKRRARFASDQRRLEAEAVFLSVTKIYWNLTLNRCISHPGALLTSAVDVSPILGNNFSSLQIIGGLN